MPDGTILISTELDEKGLNEGLSRMGKVAAAGATAVAAAITSISVAAVRVGAEFEAQMSRVSAISGATGTEITQLTDAAIQLGADTKFSASEAGKAFEYMAMAGWKTEDMLKGVGGVMDLAAASGEDLGLVSDIVTDSLTAFGLAASDSAYFSDVLASASSNANTNVSMMGATFKYVAPVAGAMGYSIEDVATAIGIMANAGIKGEQAGTSLRAMFTRLSDPPKDTAEAMQELGIRVADSTGKMKPLNVLLNDLREKFNGLSEAEKINKASALAGQEAMSGLLAIVNASDADFEKLSSAINKSSGSAAKMAQTMQDNLKGQVEQLGGSLETLGIKIYKKFETPLKNAVSSAVESVNNLTAEFSDGKLSGSMDKLASATGSLLKYLTDLAVNVLPVLISALSHILENSRPIIAVLAAITAGMIAFKAVSKLNELIQGWKAAQAAVLAYAAAQGEGALAQAVATGAMKAQQVVVMLFTGQINLATAAQWAWNAALNANPIGLVVTAVAALAAGIAVLILTMQNEKSEIDQINERLKEQKKRYQELNEAGKEQRETGLAEIDYTRKLWKELQSLIDAQGNIIGSKERAKFITEEINKLAPDSIKWINDEKIAFQESAKAIDTLIEKKRAQIILDSYEAQYKEAILNINEKQNEQAELANKLSEARTRLTEMESNAATKFWYSMTKQLGMQRIEVEKLQKTYDENEEFLKMYYNNITVYEQMKSDVASENYEKIHRINQNYGTSYKTATNATKKELAEQVAVSGQLLLQQQDRLKKGYTGITEDTVKEAKDTFTKAIFEYQKMGGNLLSGVKDGWLDNEEDFLSTVQNTVKKANEIAKKAGEVHSPSRLFARTVGKPFMQGIGKGFVDESQETFRQMQAAVQGQANELSAAVKVTSSAGNEKMITGTEKIINKIHPINIDKFIVDVNRIQEFADIIKLIENQILSYEMGFEGE